MLALSTHFNLPQCLHPASSAGSLAACAPLLGAGDPGSGHPSPWAGTYAISQESCPKQDIFLGLTQFLFLGLSNQLLQEWRGA